MKTERKWNQKRVLNKNYKERRNYVKCKGNVQIETVENELDVSLTKREHKREKSGS